MVGIAVTAVPMLDFDIFTHGNFTRLKNHPYFNGLVGAASAGICRSYGAFVSWRVVATNMSRLRRFYSLRATGKNLRTTQAAAYAVVEKIQFEGAHFRRDIVAKAF